MIILLKIALVPLLLGAVSIAGRAWGHAVGGWLAALPIIAGPIVLLITLEQGLEFGASSATGTLLGLTSLSSFCCLYALLARFGSWPIALLLSWSGFGVSTYLLSAMSGPVVLTLPFVLVWVGVVYKLLPEPNAGIDESRPGQGEIWLRMIAAGVLVLLITSFAASLGPQMSGLLAPFPIAAAVLAVFSHRFHGLDAVFRLMRGFVLGLFSYAFFFATLATMLRDYGVSFSFLSAFLVALSIHTASLGVLRTGRFGDIMKGGVRDKR